MSGTMRRRVVLLALSTLGAVLGAVLTPPAAATAAEPSVDPAPALDPAAAAYTPVAPCRLLDSRHAGGRPATAYTVAVVGACGVPVGATAAVLTLTVPSASAAGFVTAYAAGAPRPLASNVNVTAGATVAGTALVRLGTGGAVALASNVALHAVVDVVGWYAPSGPVSAGRFVSVAPVRVLDTRGATEARPGPGATVAAATADAGVPADALAVAVNLTFTETTAAGYFTAWGAGPRPLASTGNADAAGQTRAVFTLVPVAPGGALQVFTQSGAHVVVDVVGYVTGPSAPVSGDGLLVPDDPRRVLDTRSGLPVPTGGIVDVPLGVVAPSGGAAVWATVTAVDAPAAGFFVLWPTGTVRPGTSNVNASAAGQIVANAAVAQVSDRGVSVFAHPGGHVVVDVAGTFTGSPISLAPAPVSEVIGQSIEGRPIVATHRLDHPNAPHKVLVLGFMHGEEQAGLQVVTALRTTAVPATVDLWLVDTMNPDGGAARRRGNARGVDLNRNFDGGSFPWCPSPGCGAGASAVDTGTGPRSEPETQAFWAFLQRERFDLIVSYHEPLDTVDCSPHRGPVLVVVCGAYAAASGVPLNNGGYIDLSGTMTNSYMEANPGRWAFTMEFPATGVGDVSRHVAAVWAAAAVLDAPPT